ncbi:MAG: hypothetical protein IK083_01905 [Abditibacteriota bacterium]|nr:hypothetical protein [Abditibacteriota bacterium]
MRLNREERWGGGNWWRDEQTGIKWRSPYDLCVKGDVVPVNSDIENKGIDILLDNGYKVDYSKIIKYEVNIYMHNMPKEVCHDNILYTIRRRLFCSDKYGDLWEAVLDITRLCECKDEKYLEYCYANKAYKFDRGHISCSGELYTVTKMHLDGFPEYIPAIEY